MRTTIKKTTSVLAVVMMLTIHPVQATGIPTIDGANLAQAIAQVAHMKTMIENWETEFKSWVREQLGKIDGVRQFMDAQQKNQIQQMFNKRKQHCKNLSNLTAIGFCTSTVELEEKKYRILEDMDKTVQKEFQNINSTINRQNQSSSDGKNSGRAQSSEAEIQKQLLTLTNKLKQYEILLKSIDENIAQLKWARKQLTKDQLSGRNLGNTLSKSSAAAALQNSASDYRNKARNLINQKR